MLRCKAKPYTKGTQPYIFVSYSHKDKARVFPIIEKLDAEGFRVWYDEGIDPGTEWPETIAKALAGASCFISFVSKNAIASGECRREISYAFRKKIDFVSVFLEQTELSPGLDMQLSSYQSILKYMIPTQEEFYEKLLETEMLQKCRREPNNLDDGEEDGSREKVEDREEDENGNHSDDRPFNKTKLLIVIFCVVGALAIACSGFFVWKATHAKNLQDAVYHITLTAEEGAEEDAFQEDLQTIKERLDTLFAKKKYSMDVEGHEIRLVLPKSAFKEDDKISNILRCYITRRIQLYALNLDETSSFEEIPREAIENVQLLYGSIDGIDPKDYEIETEEYNYLKLTLTGEMAKKAEKLGTNIVFAQDVSHSEWFYYHTIPAPEKNTYYLIDNDYASVTLYNLQHAPLNTTFYFNTNFDEEVKWETIDTDMFGEQQCDVHNLSGKTVTVLFYAYAKDYSEGMLADDLKELKARLDLLGEPYAFGRYYEYDNRIEVAVKTTLALADDSVFTLIADHYAKITLLANLTKEDVCDYDDEETRFTAESSGSSFSVRIKKEKDLLNALAKEAATLENKKIYLMCDDCALFETEAQAEYEEDSIVFSNFAGNGNRLSPSASKIAALLNRVALKRLNQPFNYEGVYFNEDENGESADRGDFLCYDETPIDRLKAAGYAQEAFVKSNTVYVKLSLPFDNDLVKNGLKLAKKIYRAINLANSPYDGITVYLTNEDQDNERTRIWFAKSTRSASSDEKGYIYVSGIFANGRAETYKQAFLEAVSTDAFFTQFSENHFN